ncbi:DNA polymerase Y family protein [Peteryoungia desertarenae]|uniref:DNA polymerase Y family protein n=1 Tax=Peteryoungia desertarenae TaxID=1813451 RepID=A0ABX6QJN1_9HYPH|nr:DNA polymerase Y family protein [Peteryoungia desertarenae]
MNAAFTPSLLQTAPDCDRRILSLYFPRLSTDRIARRRWGLSWRSPGQAGSTGHPEAAGQTLPPLVCAGRVANNLRLTALDERAESFGLRIGQGLAEARAICPAIEVIEADPDADRSFLEAIADWCDRYTPLVAIDGSDGLMLDITGCAHLFGGEANLLADLTARLCGLGLEVEAAIGPTPGLAQACSRHQGPAIVAIAEAPDVLSPLPVKALRLAAEIVVDMARVGLKTIGDLLSAPRAPIMRRFGPSPILRLDQALGLEGEPISPRRVPAMISVERRLAEPISEEEHILDLAGRLAAGLRATLEARAEGGRLFELMLFRLDGRVFRIEVGASAPLRDPQRIRALFEERLSVLRDGLDAGFGFELLRLNVLRSEAFENRQAKLDDEDGEGEQLTRFVDQVAARLGTRALSLPLSLSSHWPDRASAHQPLSDALALLSAGSPSAASVLDAGSRPPVRGLRPLRFLARAEEVEVMSSVPDGPPASFRWRRLQRRILKAEGPERIAPEWWIDGEEAPPRDYFRVEDTAGQRFWLYREGLYERPGRKPSWFLQGFFA